MFRQLGAKDLPDLIQKSGGLVPAITRISDAYGGNKAKILGLVGSTEALNAVIGLTGEQAKVQIATLNDMRSGASAVDVAFGKQAATASARFQRMKNNIEVSAIKIGNALMPVLEKIATAVERAVNWFDSLDSGTKEVLGGFALAAAAAGPLLVGLGAIVSTVGFLQAGFAALKIALIGGAAAQAAVAGSTAAATAATAASVPVTTAATVATAGLLVPLLAVGAALAAVTVAYKTFQSLNNDLAGSGGVMGTIGEMIDQGTLDPFKAHDTALNRKATQQAKSIRGVKDQNARSFANAPTWASGEGATRVPEMFNTAPRAPQYFDTSSLGKAQEQKAKIEISIPSAPKGTRANIASNKGADVAVSMGYTMAPGGL
jgi:hypothetical protein